MKSKKFDVVVLGELNIDLVLWDIPFPENEKEKVARDMRFTMGSSSAITAHNLAVLGSKVGFIGKCGADTFGDFMIKGLQRGGVDTRGIIRDKKLKTGATIILANPPHKALLTYMGAMTEMRMRDINWNFVKQARHLHLGCYYLQTGLIQDVPKIFSKAQNLGLTTSLDTNWDPSEKWDESLYEVLKYTDVFFPNDDEAIRIAHETSLEKAVEKLRKVVKILAVKRGKEGTLVCSADEQYQIPGLSVEVIETTGAGDTFNAGFLYQFIRGKSMEECARFGNACGALAVTALGGTGAFQSKTEVKQKLKEFLKS